MAHQLACANFGARNEGAVNGEVVRDPGTKGSAPPVPRLRKPLSARGSFAGTCGRMRGL